MVECSGINHGSRFGCPGGNNIGGVPSFIFNSNNNTHEQQQATTTTTSYKTPSLIYQIKATASELLLQTKKRTNEQRRLAFVLSRARASRQRCFSCVLLAAPPRRPMRGSRTMPGLPRSAPNAKTLALIPPRSLEVSKHAMHHPASKRVVGSLVRSYFGQQSTPAVER